VSIPPPSTVCEAEALLVIVIDASLVRFVPALFDSSVPALLVSDVPERHPNLNFVSVESGVGWIPFMLETLDYEMSENAPDDLAKMKKMPSEYFRSNMFATFWFENARNKLPDLIEAVGEDSILFETDFPHPTCLYPEPLATVKDKMATLPVETQKKIYGENARKLYRL